LRVREEEEEEEEGPTKSWSRGLLEDEVTGGAGREGGALHDIGREGRSRKRNEAVGEEENRSQSLMSSFAPLPSPAR